MTSTEPAGSEVYDRARELHQQRPHGMEFEHICALLRAGIPLDTPNVHIEVTFGEDWLQALRTPDGLAPTTWHAEWRVSTGTPNYGRAALENGPDYDLNTEEFMDDGALDDLAEFIESKDGHFDTDPGLTIQVCGWALWAQGLL